MTLKLKDTKYLLLNQVYQEWKNISIIKNILFFLTCGSIIDRKNYLFLLKVFKNFNNYSLNIIGDTSRDNDYYIKIKNYVKTNRLSKKIHFIGKVSDSKLSKLYSQTDFYISVSKYEGFGMSLANSLIVKNYYYFLYKNYLSNIK